MKAQWQRLAARFAALGQRERLLIGVAVLCIVVFLGHSLLIEPQLQRLRADAKRLAEARKELPTAAATLAEMRSRLKNPDVENRAALAAARKDSAGLDAKLRALSGSLVPPERMPAFLESLLARNSKLDLLSLRNLPATFLIERGKETKDGAPNKNAPAEAEAARLPNIYKHGVEIRIAGSYSDLLAYLDDLERTPQRILWSKLALRVEQYPRSVLTLTVYTLSLDRQWLVL